MPAFFTGAAGVSAAGAVSPAALRLEAASASAARRAFFSANVSGLAEAAAPVTFFLGPCFLAGSFMDSLSGFTISVWTILFIWSWA